MIAHDENERKSQCRTIKRGGSTAFKDVVVRNQPFFTILLVIAFRLAALLFAPARAMSHTWFCLTRTQVCTHTMYNPLPRFRSSKLDARRFAVERDSSARNGTILDDVRDDDKGRRRRRWRRTFFSPTGSAPLTAQGQPAGSARGTFTRWVLSRTRRWLLFLSLILSRARLFYPANLFKRTFNSARPRVPGEHRRDSSPYSVCFFIADYQIFRAAFANSASYSMTHRDDRQESGRAESEWISPHPDRLSDSSFATAVYPPPLSSRFERTSLPSVRSTSSSSSSSNHATVVRTPVLRTRNSRPPAVFAHTIVVSRSVSLLLLLLLLFSLSVSNCLSLFLHCPFPFRVSLSICLSPFSSACCNPFCETSCARTRRRSKSERAVDRELRERERERDGLNSHTNTARQILPRWCYRNVTRW